MKAWKGIWKNIHRKRLMISTERKVESVDNVDNLGITLKGNLKKCDVLGENSGKSRKLRKSYVNIHIHKKIHIFCTEECAQICG